MMARLGQILLRKWPQIVFFFNIKLPPDVVSSRSAAFIYICINSTLNISLIQIQITC